MTDNNVAIILRCRECNLPWAEIHNGCLIVESRHHAQKHTNVIPIQTLIDLSNKEHSQVHLVDMTLATQAIEAHKIQSSNL